MHPNKKNFEEGLLIIIDGWEAMKMAVQLETAGPKTIDLKEDFIDSLLEHFDKEGPSIQPFDLEDLLMEVMSGEFMINLEDGSEVLIARSIIQLFIESIAGRVEYLNILRIRNSSSTAKQLTIINAGSNSDSGGSSDNENDNDGSDSDV